MTPIRFEISTYPAIRIRTPFNEAAQTVYESSVSLRKSLENIFKTLFSGNLQHAVRECDLALLLQADLLIIIGVADQHRRDDV